MKRKYYILGVLALLCFLGTGYYAWTLYDAYRKQVAEWNEGAKAAFEEALWVEVNKRAEVPILYSSSEDGNMKTLGAKIPDTIFITSPLGRKGYHIEHDRFERSLVKDSDKRAILGALLYEYPLSIDTLAILWNNKLFDKEIPAQSQIRYVYTDWDLQNDTVYSGASKHLGMEKTLSLHKFYRNMINKIEQLTAEISNLQAGNAEEAEQLRIKYLGRKGVMNDLMEEFRNVAPELKRELGQKINALKQSVTAKINELKESAATEATSCSSIDLTRTPYPISLGTRHPLTIVKNEIVDIFARLGFTLAEGPEVEDDWHVYSSMNFADDHPARDMQDTFFVEAHPDIILRSHTSSVQARVMETQKPPIRVICPGRVYRNEAISARAHCFFHQVEGLYIDKNVSFTDLKQVLLLFAQEMFGEETQIRLRPSYFPFTEPSAEMDISCHLCGGKGCSFCKHTGWVEILGCGMVDPAVLEANGIDSTIYTGYAFGMGIERITNLKYQVKDLRMFSENDARFLDEFKSAN